MPDWLKEWWPVIALLTPFGMGGVLWAVRTGLASKADLAKEKDAREDADDAMANRLSVEIGQLTQRMVTLEQEVRHLPSAEDFAELRNEVTKIGTLATASIREIESVGRAVTRVEDHLLKRPS